MDKKYSFLRKKHFQVFYTKALLVAAPSRDISSSRCPRAQSLTMSAECLQMSMEKHGHDLAIWKRTKASFGEGMIRFIKSLHNLTSRVKGRKNCNLSNGTAFLPSPRRLP
eukprot:TRINITY_DN7182_c0_g1_i1.p2 TRINITY_DN7182_c0_g1~~TRINITY_DN7182_c0_g1_i1.p2  ORF type:complete len:110 (+),score=0.96 TRINITY_DN7182_c0_g1_i1:355-684(+)